MKLYKHKYCQCYVYGEKHKQTMYYPFNLVSGKIVYGSEFLLEHERKFETFNYELFQDVDINTLDTELKMEILKNI